jgi:hypothetical protein
MEQLSIVPSYRVKPNAVQLFRTGYFKRWALHAPVISVLGLPIRTPRLRLLHFSLKDAAAIRQFNAEPSAATPGARIPATSVGTNAWLKRSATHTPQGWKMSSMAWDDERPDLNLPAERVRPAHPAGP